MSELKFTGTATLTGFPRDRSFNFELDGPDRLIIKAGKEIFLVIEKEPAITVNVVPDLVKAAESQIVATETGIVNGHGLPPSTIAETVATNDGTEPAGRKARGPNVKIDESQLIYIDVNVQNPYGKLRGKYYETLKTAVGRPVSWWKETSMVKSLEGSPLTLLKFFLSENTVQLRAAEAAQGGPVQPITPSFGAGQPMQQQPVAGPGWTPQGTPPPAGAPSSFL